MLFDKLTDENFVLYAAKYYDNPSCESYEEFEKDLERIKYIKRLFHKYKNGDDLKERLILNHLIILYNVFEHEACTKMLCFKLSEYISYIKPFLIALNFWPEILHNVGKENKTIYSTDVNMDGEIVKRLREI